MNKQRVKKLLPKIEKILERQVKLDEAIDLLDLYVNPNDKDDLVLQQLNDARLRKGVR
jgi:hypothetical protein